LPSPREESFPCSLPQHNFITLYAITLNQDATWSRFSFSSHSHFLSTSSSPSTFTIDIEALSPSPIHPSTRDPNSHKNSHCIGFSSSPLHSSRSSTRLNNIRSGIHGRGDRRNNRLGATAWESSSPHQYCPVIGHKEESQFESGPSDLKKYYTAFAFHISILLTEWQLCLTLRRTVTSRRVHFADPIHNPNL